MSFHLQQSTDPELKDLIAKQTTEIRELRREVQQMNAAVVKSADRQTGAKAAVESPEQMKLDAQPPLEQNSRSGVLETAVPVSQKQLVAAEGGFGAADLAFQWCAAEGSTCKCDGLVRFGAAGKWSVARNGTDGQLCTNTVFGDAAPGQLKHCECTEISLATSPELQQAMTRLEAEQSEQAVRSSIAEMMVKVDLKAIKPKQPYTMDSSRLQGKTKVLYGIATCALPKFTKIMDAVLDTWAASLPREQLVIAGGVHDDFADGLVDYSTPCGEHWSWFWCKEATVLYRAARRAEELDVDWVQVMQEDKYVWPAQVEAQLSKYNPEEAVVLAAYGCSQHWEFHESSQGGKNPRPDAWPDSNNCAEVNRFGAMCGGPSYFVSRGMLKALLEGSENLTDFLVRYRTASHGSKADMASSDIMSTCFFYRQVPDGNWRNRGTSYYLQTLTGGQSMLHTADGKVDGQQADALKFYTDWLRNEHVAGELPPVIHVNHKVDVAGYIRAMHKIDFENPKAAEGLEGPYPSTS